MGRLLSAVCVIAVSLLTSLVAVNPTSADGPLSFLQVCPPAGAGTFACMAIRVDGLTTLAATTANALPSGYGPSDLQSAYNLASYSASAGTGKTVAVVDAYNDPTALSDLCTYRSTYNLPALQSCSGGTAGPTFTKVDQSGGTNYPANNSSWSQEISLDLDMVSAVCPNCNILLVEANNNNTDSLGAGVNTAASLGAVAISNSYGGGEASTESTYDSSYYKHPGIAITASSGDSGYGAQYPAASPDVVAVGGTTLKRASNARGWTESAWTCNGTLNCALLGGAGSGCSKYEPAQPWQTALHLSGCTKRIIADVSAVADPSTGVAVSYNGGWSVYGGTSVASPIIAAVFALVGGYSSTSSPYPAALLYSHTSMLHDVTASDAHVTCSPGYLCNAGAGYDGPTGLGTP